MFTRLTSIEQTKRIAVTDRQHLQSSRAVSESRGDRPGLRDDDDDDVELHVLGCRLTY